MTQNSNGSPPIRSLADDVAKELVELFKLFADKTRLQILHYLMQQEELNVRTLCELLGQSQPAVSHHLALLRVAGLIDSRRDGKHNFYRILSGRFQQLMEMMFAAGPDQEGRICFEHFFLSYTPVRQLEEQRVESE
jgi:ArsR family transcriptional regulator